MNLDLIDPFVLAQDYPDSLTGKLRSGHATHIRFNRKGDFLAAGRIDGTVVVFDVETNGVAHKLRGHTRQIQSLSWSRDGRHLLSSSQDWKCLLWDLADGSRLRTVRFQAPVYIAELHPLHPFLFVASLFEDQPVLVDISGSVPQMHTLSSVPRRAPNDGEPEEGDEAPTAASAKQAAQAAKHATCITVFSASGSHVLAGTNKGWLNVIETATRRTVHSTRLCAALIVYLRLAPSGTDMLANASDRVIRTLHLPDLAAAAQTSSNNDGPAIPAPADPPTDLKIEVEHRFQDVVNRLAWNHVAFSATGEYVAASTYMNHDVYIWERAHGSLVKILEGPKEELGVIEWHPARPLVAACGLDSGRIYLWGVVTPQRWSALAPDFVEVEENVEYREREDEFDLHPPEARRQRALDREEDEDVDALTVEPAKGEEEAAGEGAEAGSRAFRMPVLLGVEDSESEEEVVAVGPGTMRRKSFGEGRDWGSGAEAAVGSGDERARRPANGTSKPARARRR